MDFGIDQPLSPSEAVRRLMLQFWTISAPSTAGNNGYHYILCAGMAWRAVGKSGKKQECLDHIDRVWTDMRPLSLRRHMEAEAIRSNDDPTRGDSAS